MMRVFITGATGFIGFAVAAAFSRRGHCVTGLVRSEAKAAQLRRAEIIPVVGDLAEPSSYQKAASEAQVLVHCGADMRGNMVQRDAEAVDTLLKAANGSKTPRGLIYTSGCWLHGNTNGQVVDEATPPQPLKMVAWRPAHEEKVLQSAGSHVRAVVLRPGCVYGGSGSLTGMWFGSAQQGAVSRLGKGHEHWAMIHVEDLAEAYVLAAERELRGVVLNVTNDAHLPVHMLTHAASVAAGIPGKIKEISSDEAAKQFGPLAEGLTCDQKIANDRAKRLLDWQPRLPDFVAGVHTYYAAWKAHQS